MCPKYIHCRVRSMTNLRATDGQSPPASTSSSSRAANSLLPPCSSLSGSSFLGQGRHLSECVQQHQTPRNNIHPLQSQPTAGNCQFPATRTMSVVDRKTREMCTYIFGPKRLLRQLFRQCPVFSHYVFLCRHLPNFRGNQ